MNSEIESKLPVCPDHEQQDLAISHRLQSVLVDQNLNSIGKSTGYHPETVRRYMSGKSKIPAVFIGRVAAACSTDANWLIQGQGFYPEPVHQPNMKELPTDALINELGRRMKMIEDCAVGSTALKLPPNDR